MADNFRFDIAGAPLAAALGIAFGGQGSGTTAKGWEVQEREGQPPRIILYQYECKRAQAFPAPLDLEATVALIRAWLTTAKLSTESAWHDVETSAGWRVYNEDWGHIDHQWQAFVAIEPYLLLHGK